MKSLLITLSFLVMGSAVAGPSVSGGVTFYEQYEVCSNKKEKVGLVVAASLSPSRIMGNLSEGKNNQVALKCVEGKNAKSSVTGEETVWTCSELRAGEGQLQVHINRNNAGLKYGVVYRFDIIGRLSEMYKLKCDQQISNK